MEQTGELAGRIVVITGGSSGIGQATAVQLARQGASVIITARDAQKGERAVAEINRRSAAAVSWVQLDLASFASIESCARQLLERCPKLHVLVNNAGLVLSERRLTSEGFEATFAINHLGPFLLTQLLLPRILDSGPARIVNVASDAHRRAIGGLDFDDLQACKSYNGWLQYCRSKLCNVYFTRELARRLEPGKVTVNCLHPGVVATGFGADGDTRGLIGLAVRALRPFMLDAEQGARTSVYCAASPELLGVTGQYFARCKAVAPSRHARNDAAARRLWDISEQLTRGVRAAEPKTRVA